MMNDSAHVEYFDKLRILAALSVIFMHVAADPLRAEINTSWHLLNVCTCLAFTAVPLFFMMSGYLLMSSQKTADVSVLLRHRLPRLVVPLAGWTVVALLWRMLRSRNFSVLGLWSGLVSSLNGPAMVHFWYLYTLIALYLLSPFLYGGVQSLAKAKNGKIFLFVLVSAVSAHTILMTVLPDAAAQYFNLDIFTKLKFFGGHMATFFLGWLLGSLEKKIPNALLLAGAAVTLAVITVGTWLLTARSGEYKQTFQNQSSGFEVVLAAFLFLIFKQTSTKRRPIVKAVTTPIVALLLPVYLMHNIFISMLNSIGIYAHSFSSTLLITLLTFVVCFVVTKTVATVKPLCYLATGMKFDDACRKCNWVATFRRLRRRSRKNLIDADCQI